ncbi:DUF1236 domain-containing protein [Hansschlegelia beijingensis]
MSERRGSAEMALQELEEDPYVAGAAIGTAVAPPREVREYVVRDSRPSVRYRGEVEVGSTLPADVEVYQVPDSDYSYTVVNDRRYIVSSKRKVVEVVE